MEDFDNHQTDQGSETETDGEVGIDTGTGTTAGEPQKLWVFASGVAPFAPIMLTGAFWHCIFRADGEPKDFAPSLDLTTWEVAKYEMTKKQLAAEVCHAVTYYDAIMDAEKEGCDRPSGLNEWIAGKLIHLPSHGGPRIFGTECPPVIAALLTHWFATFIGPESLDAEIRLWKILSLEMARDGWLNQFEAIDSVAQKTGGNSE